MYNKNNSYYRLTKTLKIIKEETIPHTIFHCKIILQEKKLNPSERIVKPVEASEFYYENRTSIYELESTVV